MQDPYKINFVTAPPAPPLLKQEKEVNLIPMSAEEVQLLKDFLQREMDVLREDLRGVKDENADAHRDVSEQIGAVRKDIADLSGRVKEVESHEETEEQADAARKEVKDSLRRTFLAGNAVLGTLIVVIVYLIDHY